MHVSDIIPLNTTVNVQCISHRTAHRIIHAEIKIQAAQVWSS